MLLLRFLLATIGKVILNGGKSCRQIYRYLFSTMKKLSLFCKQPFPVHTTVVKVVYNWVFCEIFNFIHCMVSLQKRQNFYNKSAIAFIFCMIVRIMKPSVGITCFGLSLQLREITQTSVLIILAIMLYHVHLFLNTISYINLCHLDFRVRANCIPSYLLIVFRPWIAIDAVNWK